MRSRLLFPAVALASLLVAACGGGSTNTSAPTTPPPAPGTSGSSTPSGGNMSSPTSAGLRPPKASPGCGSSAVGALDKERKTMQVGGRERFFILTTPPAHDGKTPIPLVVDFHGLSEGAQVHTAMSNYTPLAQSEGFAVAFPNGSGQPVRWDTNPSPDNQDLAFVDAMLAQLENTLCIDTSRVYATGLSYGAIMTSFLTCQRSGTFAAVAPVAGLMAPEPCEQSRKVPILAFHGTADPILAFNGGGGNIPGISPAQPGATTTTVPNANLDGPGFPANAKTWAERYGCDPKPTDNKVSEHVLRRVYTCPKDAEVEFVAIIGGGHAWPGSEFSKAIGNIVGETTTEIDATKESWKFFQQHQLP